MKTKWIVAAIAAALVSGTAGAQWGPGDCDGSGPGMAGGYGQGMGGGYDQGAGPGMMGGRGQGAGPGVVGGRGQGAGPGMMGGRGQGMGPGMMGGFGSGQLAGLDLAAAQREKITAIQKQARQEHWGLMGAMHELQWQLAEPGTGGDAKALETYDAMASLRRRMFEASLATRKRIDEVLTPEQRKKLRG